MGPSSEVGSETAIHSVIQARPWTRGEGPKRKCAIDSGGLLCGCVELVGAETTECAAATGVMVSLSLDRIRLDLECKPASSTDLRNQLDVTPGNTLPCKSAERLFIPTWLTLSRS